MSNLPDLASLSISSNADYPHLDFPGKEQQKEAVIDILDKQGFIPETVIEEEVEWFYTNLGIDDQFFSKETNDTIANLVLSLYCSKVDSIVKSKLSPLSFSPVSSSSTNNTSALTITNKVVTENHAIYMDSNIPSRYDVEIDDKYLDNSTSTTSYRLQSFQKVSSGIKITFIYENDFPNNENKDQSIESISDSNLLNTISFQNKKLYQLILNKVGEREGPVIQALPSVANPDELRIVIGYKKHSAKHYYSSLCKLFSYYNVIPNKIFLESFANDMNIFSIYISKKDNNGVEGQNFEMIINQIVKECSLLYCIPTTYFDQVSQFSPQEAIYAHIGSIFINHFIDRIGKFDGESKLDLNSINNDLLEIIIALKKKLRTQSYSQTFIMETLVKHKDIVCKLFKNFALIHYISSNSVTASTGLQHTTLSYQRLETVEPFANEESFENTLLKVVPSDDSPDYLILKTLNIFNKSILKTNFFITRKVAISFRLIPNFILNNDEFPDVPYGIFFVVGSTFKGFHIRFRDIARGGIRIVCSKNEDVYETNSKMMIEENYNLASTQQKKNKDIPEGGSKGVILMNTGLLNTQDTFIAFQKYVDSIIDILIKDPLKEQYVDLLGVNEILFFGPDEGTATFVDWATTHARKRNCPWWKSFLTGKSQDLGGIPHDVYGMTSLGVRAFVESIYEKEDLLDSKVYKFQTGGPDGDLGSNEILLSSKNEVYVAIVDGSGVIVDPQGLDKNELASLAEKRVTCSHYDLAKLSTTGFFVSVDAIDFKLPNGEIVPNGTTFRNKFHTDVFKYVEKVDIFVPCGGRPSSINLSNLHCFIDPKTNKVRIPYIVEGANLFITQAAKIALEEHGCVLFKDATANKGGVTSSSMEVLASLALNDDDFVKIFVGNVNGTYDKYVKFVQQKIKANAEAEFHQLWDTHEKIGTPMATLSNTLSASINKLNDDLINSSELWSNDLKLRNYLLLECVIPKILVDIAGKDKILNNIPEAYLKAMLSAYLSSTFVYKYGIIDINMGHFLEFIGDLNRKSVSA
ncbi:related to NAD-specific glutamate dehydrogenase [Saccharomycodes ludwigii]|uniref:NAD-specific glutamate dehydrogenase n=1 Tax=Saccharomycodes ludwigii TaxID=36035 RepID=A0A376B815_9ASCO|nr:hypothetical protein SCDLUD_002978 [Saccharomycodes ludwigii]KAH3901483.1 hypothetical protein SCDLUD_002978 [Saccharomycodes ludwigii]SSD60802.1 related to NAD-specific glutamate dehydrogenase [Saccharomycodes ludwigii]